MKIENKLNLLIARSKINSISELADELGVLKTTLWRFYQNDQKLINKELTIKVCQYFDCELSDLFELVSDQEYEERNKGLVERKEKYRVGCVYFIKNESNNLVKIGRTSSLNTRLENLRAEYKQPLTLIGTIETKDTINSELEMHKRYKDKRFTGEWFKLTDKDIGEIKEKFLN